MVHGCIIHLEIRGDKIWIHRDESADGMAGELLAAGVPKENIVLVFYLPETRELTDFAVC